MVQTENIDFERGFWVWRPGKRLYGRTVYDHYSVGGVSSLYDSFSPKEGDYVPCQTGPK